jgi:hypothetical protein
MRTFLPWCSLAGALILPLPAYAVTADVPFSGTVNSTCTIVVNSDGVLAANATATVLGSNIAGGSAGLVTVTTNDASFDVSVADPINFAGPGGFTGSPTFLTEFALTGATAGSGNAASAPLALASGVTDVDVDLTATLAAGTFDAGGYTATVVLTCE